MFDNLDLSILNDLAELQIALERSPEGGNKRWTILQTWLRSHKNIKKHLEVCLDLGAGAATDYIFQELAFELTGMRLTPAVIRFAAKEKYEFYRPKVESTVGMVLGLYAARAEMEREPKKLKPRGTRGKKGAKRKRS